MTIFNEAFAQGLRDHDEFRAEVSRQVTRFQFERIVANLDTDDQRDVSTGQLYAALLTLGFATVTVFSLLAVWLIGKTS